MSKKMESPENFHKSTCCEGGLRKASRHKGSLHKVSPHKDSLRKDGCPNDGSPNDSSPNDSSPNDSSRKESRRKSYFGKTNHELAEQLRQAKDSRIDRLVQYLLMILMFVAISALAISNQAASAKLGLPVEKPVVVLDAGHGGVDPGKIGANSALEKEVNLSIVMKLKEYLEANDVTVYLTRETDDGLYEETDGNKKLSDLSRRCELIEEVQPDIAVSIHQNSYSHSTVCGPQIFYYKTSEKGRELAEILQARLNAMPECLKQRVAKANGDYYLLLHVSCPIVIAETGFLSNWEEAQMLVTEEYQDRLAWELCMGILSYLN